MRWLLWLPLALFALIVAVAMSGLLHPASTDIRSQLVGQPMPEFSLPVAVPGHPPLAKTDIRGGPRLINIFASWCLPCAVEAPQLMALKRAGVVIEGIAIRDRPEDLAAFRHGRAQVRVAGRDDNEIRRQQQITTRRRVDHLPGEAVGREHLGPQLAQDRRHGALAATDAARQADESGAHVSPVYLPSTPAAAAKAG